MQKQIDRSTYLKAMGLFTLAQSRMRVVDQCEREARELLGLESGSHVADAFFDSANGDLDEALRREKITVRPEESIE